jgi:hypothetical protein
MIAVIKNSSNGGYDYELLVMCVSPVLKLRGITAVRRTHSLWGQWRAMGSGTVSTFHGNGDVHPLTRNSLADK